MIDHFLPVRFDAGRGLQEQLREALVTAILGGGFPADQPLPSCRKLAAQLRVSRNTVNLVYESLLDSGYIVSQPRRGFFLAPAYAEGAAGAQSLGETAVPNAGERASEADEPDWDRRFKLRPGLTSGVFRPQDWARFPYPFVYGQPMRDLFPLERWREASRKALRRETASSWLHDRFDRDDDMLVEQLRTRVLPKRGIWAKPSEILVTLGSQNALYLIAALLMNGQTRVAMETPGFRDALSIFDCTARRCSCIRWTRRAWRSRLIWARAIISISRPAIRCRPASS